MGSEAVTCPGWTKNDTPSGPYFHGTRTVYSVGDSLHVRPVDPDAPDPRRRDARNMCFATTEVDTAFGWGVRRSSYRGDTVFVYEVALLDPEVDTNAHGLCRFDGPTSVMARRGVVTRIHATGLPLRGAVEVDPGSIELL